VIFEAINLLFSVPAFL